MLLPSQVTGVVVGCVDVVVGVVVVTLLHLTRNEHASIQLNRFHNIIGTVNRVQNLPIVAPEDAVRAAYKRHRARVVPLTAREHQGETHPLRGGSVACGGRLTPQTIVRSVGDHTAVASDRCGR